MADQPGDEKRGQWAKKVTTLSDEVTNLRKALVIALNVLQQGGFLQPADEQNLQRLVGRRDEDG